MTVTPIQVSKNLSFTVTSIQRSLTSCPVLTVETPGSLWRICARSGTLRTHLQRLDFLTRLFVVEFPPLKLHVFLSVVVLESGDLPIQFSDFFVSLLVKDFQGQLFLLGMLELYLETALLL